MTTPPLLKSRYICPAKINLGLEVLRKREDGYHELNTLFVRVDEPHDLIEVSRAKSFRLSSSVQTLALDESNLIQKAAAAYSQHTGLQLPQLHLHLEKNIPMGAGLGGGSSNAATTLQICNDFFDQPMSVEELAKIGAKVGADVPFFVTGYIAAIASGIGEQLKQADLPLSAEVLIVKPATVSISTKDAYARITPRNTGATDLLNAVNSGEWSRLQNDFEAAIFPLNPELQTIKQQLLAQGAFYTSMSGSGSAIYGLFADKNAIERATEKFNEIGYPSWQSSIGQKR